MAVNLNECLVSGTVIEEPQFSGEGEDAWGFLQLHTNFPQVMPDGSYKDVDQIIQVVSDMTRHTNTMRKYIKKGKALTVSAYYRTWNAGGVTNHGMFVRKLIFATANYGQENTGYQK